MQCACFPYPPRPQGPGQNSSSHCGLKGWVGALSGRGGHLCRELGFVCARLCPGHPRDFVWALLRHLPQLASVSSGHSLAPSGSFLLGRRLSDSALPLPLQAHWTMPENVLMGIRRGLGLALVLSISFCWCELSHSTLDFWAPEHGSGQGATSNL